MQPIALPVISQELLQENGPLLIQKIAEVAPKGFFYLEMPEECKSLDNCVSEFAIRCFNDPSYRSNPKIYEDGGGNIQREQIFFSQDDWTRDLPKDVAAFARSASSINIQILKIIYRWCGFKESEYEKLSGGATSGKGLSYLNFSHYRPEMQRKGMGEHQDSGDITLLFIDKIGLKVFYEGNWVPVNPMKNHYVIIFGESLEVLINDKTKLTAVNHCVDQCLVDRISIALFTEHHKELPVYQKSGNELVVFEESGEKFFERCLAHTNAFK